MNPLRGELASTARTLCVRACCRSTRSTCMYWESSGTPDGIPVVFLHGGPGAGAPPHHRRFFDPAHLPHRRLRPARRRPLDAARGAARQHDAAPHRRHRAAAQAPRHRALAGVRRLLGQHARARLRARRIPSAARASSCAASSSAAQSEIDWFLYGLRNLFPEAVGTLRRAMPAAERDDLLAAYYKRLTDPDPAVHLPAARAWSIYEGSCSTLLPQPGNGRLFRRRRRRAGPRAHRGALLRHDIFLPGKRRCSTTCTGSGTSPA